jgi:DNA-directed RNA polymerase subunit RPC12/RpoP
MTDHFIKLNCENCGADFDVYDDMERFACGYCGTEIVVQRRGGTVVLKSMAQATKNMAAGADQTAAELALVRLKEEAEGLSKRYDATQKERVERNKRGYIIGISLLLVGFVVVRSGYSLMLGLSLLLAGIFTISYIRRHDKKVAVDLRELHAKLDVLNGRIEDHAFRP